MDTRCFISIELPDSLKIEIGNAIRTLGKSGADVRWVKADNLHLTLKFLGNTPDKLIPEITKRLSETLRFHNGFNIRISGAGVFPNLKYPRIVWLGIRDSDEIIKIQRDVDDAMKEFGFETEDREFRPHLTIGRVRSPKNKDYLLKEIATLKDVDFGKIEVFGISLMKSVLKPGGSEYSRLSEIPLEKGMRIR